MSRNPLKQLGTLGQSIWLDYIRRDLIANGGLRRLIEEDGLRGMTSNPSIFEKAIAESHDVAEAARVLKRLTEIGINIDKVTPQLEDEGVTKFNQPFDKLMETLAQRSLPYLTRVP